VYEGDSSLDFCEDMLAAAAEVVADIPTQLLGLTVQLPYWALIIKQ